MREREGVRRERGFGLGFGVGYRFGLGFGFGFGLWSRFGFLGLRLRFTTPFAPALAATMRRFCA
eukprot:1740048-Prorocentrum_lima.AAC.1